MLAEIYFMIVIGIALLTSKAWRNQQRGGRIATAGRTTTMIVCTTWALTFVQFFLGALTRHTDAWGVSTSFPQWSDEGFFPSSEFLQYAQVVIHLTHRTTAYVVALIHAQAHRRQHRIARRPLRGAGRERHSLPHGRGLRRLRCGTSRGGRYHATGKNNVRAVPQLLAGGRPIDRPARLRSRR